MKKEIRYYTSPTDDFVTSKNQNFVLPASYQWIQTGAFRRFLSGIIYGCAILFGNIYCRCALHVRIKGKKNLRGRGGHFFLYGNHTQPVGDVFIPALCALPRRIYTLVSPANFGIPFIGKILPYLGALPIVATPRGIRHLYEAINLRLDHRHPIVIFPEAHVWEYYPHIRPFPPSSFRFPVKFDAPVFAMTATYRKGRLFRRPVMTVYIDGPFFPRGKTEREMASFLCDQVHAAMTKRARESNVSYIEYKKREQE